MTRPRVGTSPPAANHAADESGRGIHTNPYFGHELKSPKGPDPSPYDERIKGLDGEMLDAMIRGRGQEVLAIGHADGFKEAATRYASIFEEGYGTGQRDGAIMMHAQLSQACAESFVKAQTILAEIGMKTGSPKLRALAEEGNAALATAVEAFTVPPLGQ